MQRLIKRGDTVIEVTIAITMFCLVAIIAITLMDSGINTAEGSLETIMARNEIDAQAEALRFIQNSYLAEREIATDQQQYTELWKRIVGHSGDVGLAIDSDKLPSFNIETCEAAYADIRSAFIINTRRIEPSDSYSNSQTGMTDHGFYLDQIIISPQRPENEGRLQSATLYPRIIFSRLGGTTNTSDDILQDQEGDTSGSDSDFLYRAVNRAEGIWIFAVKGNSDASGKIQFYDFHIRTCWQKPGNSFVSTIGTIVRLYNPEISG